jgi:predicted MFS family arabinose efflux permease
MPNRRFSYFLLIVCLHGFLGQVVGMFMPLYLRDIGFSGLQIGLFFGAASAANIILSLPMGVSTDRRSIAGIMAVSFILVAVSRLGLVFTTSFVVFCLFAFIGSFGARFHGTARTTLFFKMTGADNRHEAGVFQLINFVGMGLGMILGGLLITASSFRHVFVFSTAANLLLAGMCLLLPRNETVAIKVEDYKKALLHPQVLFLALVFFLSSFHLGAEQTSYSPFLRDVLGLSITQTGLYIGVGFFAVGGGAVLGSMLLKHGMVRGLESILYLGFVLGGVFHILMCVPNAPLSFFFRLFHEIGDGLVFLAFYHGVTRIFNLDRIGGCAAFISLCMGMGGFCGALVFGVVSERMGPQWPFVISGMVLTALPLLLKYRGRAFALTADTATG